MRDVREIEAEVVCSTMSELGECPSWNASAQTLNWVDVKAGVVYSLLLGRCAPLLTSWHVGEAVGAVVPRRRGGLALAVASGFALLDGKGSVKSIAGVPDGIGYRMNDGKCDAMGRFWAGTIAERTCLGRGALYRLSPGGAVTCMLRRVGVSNGMDWSPDNRWFYFIDTSTQEIDRFAFCLETGNISGRTRAIAIGRSMGRPDGMTVDDEGCLWVALWGGGVVHRYEPNGRLVMVVRLPVSQVTSCTFGGYRGEELFITTAKQSLGEEELRAQPLAGAVFGCFPGISGPPANPFAG